MTQLLNQLLLVVKLKYSLRMLHCHHHGWVNRYEYLCYKWPEICYACCNHNPVIFSFMILLFVAIVARPVSHMKLKLFTIVGHQSSTLVLCRVPGACSFVCCVMSLFVLFLLIISLSFLFRLTASGYPFAIFNHFLRLCSFL
jgi:hypothetical protein